VLLDPVAAEAGAGPIEGENLRKGSAHGHG
jgi:hypothetical protein